MKAFQLWCLNALGIIVLILGVVLFTPIVLALLALGGVIVAVGAISLILGSPQVVWEIIRKNYRG